MKRILLFALLAFSVGDADGRGGGFSGGGGGHSYGGGGFSSFSGDRGGSGGSYSGSHSYSGSSGFDRSSASGSYDHSYTSNRGGSINTEGNRGAAVGPNGFAAGSNRDTSVTTAGGKTFNNDSSRGVAGGWGGPTVGGRSDTYTGAKGNTANWNSAFAGNRYTGNAAHYSSFNASGAARSTSYWSAGYTNTHASAIRSGFGYYGCFNPGWYARYPGSWYAAGWAAGAAWNVATWPVLGTYCGITAAPIDYDYGTTVAITGNNIYLNGQDQGSVSDYAQAATTLATQGQASAATTKDDWQPLGVFALAQGDDPSSNNIFQLAVNKAGTIRGNYYDGLLDTTAEVYGAVDKVKQVAAWTIGTKKDRVFEAGIYNLTEDQCPCLVHVGTDKTLQMMLVRVQQPKTPETP